MKKICIIGVSGKLGRYMLQHALDKGYDVTGVCRAQSVDKLSPWKDRMTIITGTSNDRDVIRQAVSNCDGVLTVLVPWGVQQYASGTAQAVLDFAPADARLVFSCGWHISRDGKDVYPLSLRMMLPVFTFFARLFRFADISDQVEACRRIFSSDRRWTVVRCSDIEEGESEGLPVWSQHVGDPVLASNRTRRIDFALFMVAALENDSLIQQAPAIVSCKADSALRHEAEH
ncbi:MAG: short-chain dehydrogenase [Gammaproteobacteria bacterium]|nr:short-chain dehydrogenase [Gammaproteobacteria bacterium]|tara:strand:+ start:225763 stop:226452 length:690 start_codon:yes stop_codon:yes gene_type:complete